MVLLFILKRMKCLNKFPYLKSKVDSTFAAYFWNGLITSIAESHLVLSVIGAIGVSNLRFGSDETPSVIFCSVFSVLLATLCVAFPVVVYYIYTKKFKSNFPVPDNHESLSLIELTLVVRIENIAHLKHAYTKSEDK